MVKELWLFSLDVGVSNAKDSLPQGRILSCRPDGSASKTVVEGIGTLPDGLAMDPPHRHIYYTNIGKCVTRIFTHVCSPLFVCAAARSGKHGADFTAYPLIETRGRVPGEEGMCTYFEEPKADMGKTHRPSTDSGSVSRVDLDGTNDLVVILKAFPGRQSSSPWSQ